MELSVRTLLAMALGVLWMGCPPVRGALFDAGNSSTPPTTTPGIPPGTALTPVTGPLVLSQDDEVVEGQDVDGCVTITGARVTFRNSRVRCGREQVALNATGTSGTQLIRLEVDGLSNADIGIVCENCVVSWVDVHHVNQGVRLGSGATLEDSVIHELEDPTTAPGFSAGMYGMASLGGTGIRARRNTITPGVRAFGAVLVGSDVAALSDVVVEDNLLDDGSFTVYAGAGQSFPATNIVFQNNRIGRGAVRGPKSLSTGVTWTNNVWADTGEVIP